MRSVHHGALEEELNRCLPRVYRYARFLCGRREDDADDLVQTAIAEWLQRPADGLPVFVQLRQLVRSRFIDSVRAKRTQDVPLDDDTPCQPSTDRDVAIRDVLERLPTEDRLLLWMVYGQGFSVDDAATELRVNSRTVKRRLARARATFAAIFGEE